MFCPKCGTKNIKEAKFCSSCGEKLENVETTLIDSPIITKPNNVHGKNEPKADRSTLQSINGKFIGIGIAIILIAIVIIKLSTGVSAPPNEEQMQKDLPYNGTFDTLASSIFETGYKIDEIKINARNTDKKGKTDDSKCLVTVSSDDVKAVIPYKIDYSYYDKGGWMLDSVYRDPTSTMTIVPLTTVPDEDVKNDFDKNWQNNPYIQNITHETDLVGKKDRVTITTGIKTPLYSNTRSLVYVYNFSINDNIYGNVCSAKWAHVSTEKKDDITEYNITGIWKGKAEDSDVTVVIKDVDNSTGDANITISIPSDDGTLLEKTYDVRGYANGYKEDVQFTISLGFFSSMDLRVPLTGDTESLIISVSSGDVVLHRAE